tara:strand:- start:603 stop:770 length:168 start_codon:yes stop_codon:yes gene_type:complete
VRTEPKEIPVLRATREILELKESKGSKVKPELKEFKVYKVKLEPLALPENRVSKV